MSPPFTYEKKEEQDMGKTGKITAGVVASLAVIAFGASLNGGGTPAASKAASAPSPSAASGPCVGADCDVKEQADSGPTAVPQAELPAFSGMVHQDAQDAAQLSGFYRLAEEDASGKDRLLLNDSNWTVCYQVPKPGVYPLTTKITLYSVKTGETCR